MNSGMKICVGLKRRLSRSSCEKVRLPVEDWTSEGARNPVLHEPRSISRSSHTFRRLIDIAIHHRGSFFLTYHRYAIAAQLLACYPQLPEFLQTKQRFDPDEVFRSDWYRYYQSIGRDVEFA